jgi:hypothetical protein
MCRFSGCRLLNKAIEPAVVSDEAGAIFGSAVRVCDVDVKGDAVSAAILLNKKSLDAVAFGRKIFGVAGASPLLVGGQNADAPCSLH